MIELEDIDGLTGLSPEQKFYTIERLARRPLAEAKSVAESASGYSNQYVEPAYTEHDCAVDVSAAAKEFGIEELADFKLPWPTDETAEHECRMYRAQCTQISQQLLYRYGTKNQMVSLDSGTKERIGHWLKQIREAVQAADIPGEKKDRLFRLVNLLQAGVDRERTPVHAAGELWLTTCTYVGEGGRALEPVISGIERIGAALGLAKKAEGNQPKLPTRKEPKQLEGPRKRLPQPKKNGFDNSLDEEIPF